MVKLCLLGLYSALTFSVCQSWQYHYPVHLPHTTDCQSIVVTPPTNQTVPINSDVNVTYNCIVDGGRLAEWVFNTIQVPSGSSLVQTLARAGIFIEEGITANETNIVITRRGRETFSNKDLQIGCTALTQSTDNLEIEFGPVNFVRTFGERLNIDSNSHLYMYFLHGRQRGSQNQWWWMRTKNDLSWEIPW